MSHDVVHFEVGGPDGQALKKFYVDLFGWKTDDMDSPPYVSVHRSPGGIGGGIAQPPDGRAYVTVYVSCPKNIAETLTKAESMGASTILPVSDIPNGPTIALFNDPDGNVIGLVNDDGNQPVLPADGSGPAVNWFEIGGKDGAKTQKWYSDLFGWKIDANNPMSYGMVPAPENAIGGGVYGGAEEGPSVGICVDVDDLDATLKKAGELGGKTVAEPMDVPGGPKYAKLADPVGNVIALTLKDSVQPA
jgi:predicted enzyme related to lactoylglutathione lyase